MKQPQTTDSTAEDVQSAALQAILDALRGLRFVSITVTVQDGVVVQIERFLSVPRVCIANGERWHRSRKKSKISFRAAAIARSPDLQKMRLCVSRPSRCNAFDDRRLDESL